MKEEKRQELQQTTEAEFGTNMPVTEEVKDRCDVDKKAEKNKRKKEKGVKETMEGMEGAKKKRTKLVQHTWAKVLAFLLVIVCSIVTAGSVVAAVGMLEMELYTTPEEKFQTKVFTRIAKNDASQILSAYLLGEEGFLQEQYEDTNITGVLIEKKYSTRWLFTEVGKAQEQGTAYESMWFASEEKYGTNFLEIQTEEEYLSYRKNNATATKTYKVIIYVDETLPKQDAYYLANMALSLMYEFRYFVYAIAVVAFLLVVVCFVFLMCASGHHVGEDEVKPGWGTKVPFDLVTVAAGTVFLGLLGLIMESVYFASPIKIAIACFSAGLGMLIVLLGWCMSFAVRMKLGEWWKNTLIFRCFMLAWWIVKKVWTIVCGIVKKWNCFWKNTVVHGTKTLLQNIPLIGKTILLLAVITTIEFVVIVCAWQETDIILVAWIIEKIILVPIVLYLAIVLRKLQKSGEALAQGNLNHQADTKYMVWEFKKYEETLNRISEGMTVAVEERLKSERMKTELITNVSHDIKTPLTSIINYADIIYKEPVGSEKVTEYAEVLHRQSERLKRLIDDLVEASKASTGNLEVCLAPCETGILLAQAAGEYEERLQKKSLRLVTKQPEHPVMILADGRRLWRIMDNLMNNIYKYAQEGTRVYIILEEKAGKAVITFKNISRDALDISTDELMERFVRGDSARNTDGSGLGLSIAKSLVELQHGTMELAVDGDLFKVILTFPVVQQEES